MLVLTDVQKVRVAVRAVSAAGNPAVLDGVPVWSVSDDSVLSLVVGEGGLFVDVFSTGKLGAAQLKVEADADLGDGVRALFGVLDFSVVASEAVNLSVEAGVPEVVVPVVPEPAPAPEPAPVDPVAPVE
jgi:hypothetical protein